MKLFTQGRYSTIVSTAALVLALGGTSYAAAQITSSDIRDNTIQTRDINPAARTIAKSIQNDHGTAIGSTKTVLSLNLAAGNYFVTAKSVAESGTDGAYTECWLAGPSSSTMDIAWWWGGAGHGYGTLSNQAVLHLGSTGTVQLQCSGFSSTLYYKKLTAVRVASVADLTGADVAKTAHPRSMTPRR